MKYTIKKGRHYASPLWARLWPFTPKIEVGLFEFEEGSELAVEDIPGWNKLTGFSSWRIHKNSGRLVWRANGSRISIAAYVYDNGKRIIEELKMIEPGEIYTYSIKNTGSVWWFEIDGIHWPILGRCDGMAFKCHPYFGGESTAPMDIHINIDRL